MTFTERMIQSMEARGIAGARAVVEELVRGGALTDYDAAKYMARHEVLRIVSEKAESTYRIIEEVAYHYSISQRALAQACGQR